MEKKNDIKTEWLSEYQKTKRSVMNQRLSKFLEWSKKSPEQLSKLDNKEAKHLLIQFNNAMKESGVKNNTTLAYVSASKTFLEYCGIPIRFRRGQLVNAQEGIAHSFSNGDLGSMFNIANPQYKALIATLCSCGHSINDVLAMDKEKIKVLIERAKANNEDFLFIETRRGKTNAKSLMCLNPLAVEWLEKWITQNRKPSLWNVKEDGVLLMLKKLAKRSGIKFTESIKTHRIRAWLMSSLSKAGFNEFEMKYCVGKKIPLSDSTYLGLKEAVIEKYIEAYPKYLNILGYQVAMETTEITELKQQLEESNLIQKGMIKAFGKQIFNEAMKQLNHSNLPELQSMPMQYTTENLIKLLKHLATT